MAADHASPTATEAGPRPRLDPWPWVIMAAVLAITVAALRWEGRRWWCACATPRVWISDVWSEHCSQHLFDPYSLTHFSHGLLFAWGLWIVVPRWSRTRQLAAALTLGAAWEVLENSPLIIERYRTATMSLNYLGDSVVNSMGDILACAIGFLVATRLGFRWSLLLFLAIEAVLLWWIRDNLTLGVLMLIRPVDAIKAWQTAIAPAG
jgi:hypothetical protein